MQILSELLSTFEVLSIRLSLVYSPEVFQETVGVETSTIELINDDVSFQFQSFPERRMDQFSILLSKLVEKRNAFFPSTDGSRSARSSRSLWCFPS